MSAFLEGVGGVTLTWIAAMVVSALMHIGLSLAVGARLALGRLAAERLADESGLEEALDPGSRLWGATQLLRHLFLVLVPIFAVAAWGEVWSVALPVAIGTVVLGRVLQDLVAPRAPRALLATLAPLLRVVDLLLGPLVSPLAKRHEHAAEKVMREQTSVDEDLKEEQMEEYIQEAEEGGLIEREQGQLLREIVDVGDTLVREIMTPRGEIAAVSAEASLDEAARVIIESFHSRLPVYEGDLDHVVGVLSVRDLLPVISEGGSAKIRELMRPVLHVPGSKLILELMRELQKEQQQMAIVVDEFGSTSGIVTIEDILEEIVGEIRDEHEKELDLVIEEGASCWLADGLLTVEDLEDLIRRDLPEAGVETVGGLVFTMLARIPKVGDEVEPLEGVRLRVAEMSGRRIARVRIECAADDDPARTEG